MPFLCVILVFFLHFSSDRVDLYVRELPERFVDAPSKENIILIVDDNAPNRHLLRVILKKEGYETAECADGKECLEFCEKIMPDLILLDVMMPHVDGITVCRTLRERYSKSQLPIIMVTTKTSGSDLATGFDAGANDYVNKPVDRHSLLARIENQHQILRYQKHLREEKLRTERALRIQNALGDALPQGVVVCNSDGMIVNTNRVIVDLCGQDGLSSIEKIFDRLYGGVLSEKYQNDYVSRLEDLHCEIDEEVEVFGDPTRNIIVVSKPIHQKDETQLRLWVFRDISHERELERRMSRQVRMETVGLFASGVAHNFNNLLGGVLGASQLLRRMGDDSERYDRCLRILERAVESGMALTKRMSMVAKKPEGSSTLEGSGFDVLAQLAWEYVERKPGVKVSLELVGATSLFLEVSRRDLIGILQNLFQNSVDSYQKDGVVRCEVETQRQDSEAVARIRISDQGCGMSPEALEKVYEPFFSTKNLDHRNQVSVEGRGLGMWSVYNLVSIYGGEIALASKEGRGTTVQIVLPLKVQEQEKEDEGAAESAA